MRVEWIAEKGMENLVLFFAGWGMDARPFRGLSSTCSDVLVVYDYTEDTLPMDLPNLFERYTCIDLVAWSFGVAVANRIGARWGARCRTCVAVNGSILPIDEQYGISPPILEATQKRLEHGGIERFRRRMCGGQERLDRFNAALPDRDPASLGHELEALKRRYRESSMPPNIFTHAWVGTGDRIIPAENQLRAWARCHVDCVVIDEPHFPFYRWSQWEEITCPEGP